MNRKLLFILFLYLSVFEVLRAQDPWKIKVDKIDKSSYNGVTVANGMVGVISSSEPLKASNIILAGTYDLYGRGRVDNFLNGFNMLNLKLIIDGTAVNSSNVSNFMQELDMKEAVLKSSFTFKDLAKVTYTFLALRQLPYSIMLDVTVEPLKDVTITAINMMETPDAS